MMHENQETLLRWTQQARDVWDFTDDRMVAEQEGMKGLASQAKDFGVQDCPDIPRRWRLVRGLLRESWFKGSSDSRPVSHGLDYMGHWMSTV